MNSGHEPFEFCANQNFNSAFESFPMWKKQPKHDCENEYCTIFQSFSPKKLCLKKKSVAPEICLKAPTLIYFSERESAILTLPRYFRPMELQIYVFSLVDRRHTIQYAITTDPKLMGSVAYVKSERDTWLCYLFLELVSGSVIIQYCRYLLQGSSQFKHKKSLTTFNMKKRRIKKKMHFKLIYSFNTK